MKIGNYFYRYWFYNLLLVKLNVKISYLIILEFIKIGRFFVCRMVFKFCL